MPQGRAAEKDLSLHADIHGQHDADGLIYWAPAEPMLRNIGFRIEYRIPDCQLLMRRHFHFFSPLETGLG